jgi:adenosine kinase
MGEKEVLEQVDMLIVTKGEKGSTVITKSGQTDVPAVEPRRIADPTGVGDAFRGGLMKGFAMGLSADAAARIGSVAATYCLEHLGGTYHSYTWDEFEERYKQHFGALAAVK